VGVNNRQRRAARKRKRSASGRGRAGGRGEPGASYAEYGASYAEYGATYAEHGATYAEYGATYADNGSYNIAGCDDPVELLVAEAIGVLEDGGASAEDLAGLLLAPSLPERATAVVRVLKDVLQRSTAAAGHKGWSPRDLGELARRRLSADHQPLLVSLLHDEAQRHPPARVAPRWREEIAAIGPRTAPDLQTTAGLALALGLTALLAAVPPLPRLIQPPGQSEPCESARRRAQDHGQDGKILARVRALLAKAESTEFPDEAEALSAKAQELISRYSLDQLLTSSTARARSNGTDISARRLWLDAPYVRAKAHLVHQVAVANRCSTVSAERLGFTTVAGAPRDLDAVELVTTSLMVQADAAMLAAGRAAGRGAATRTASYRRAFLLAYATRIGQRLRAADGTAVAAFADSHSGDLAPVLRRQEERVDEALAEMYPHTVRRASRVGNLAGWAAGTAAADLARLDATRPIAGATMWPAGRLDGLEDIGHSSDHVDPPAGRGQVPSLRAGESGGEPARAGDRDRSWPALRGAPGRGGPGSAGGDHRRAVRRRHDQPARRLRARACSR
jgi:hypothetical protein